MEILHRHAESFEQGCPGFLTPGPKQVREEDLGNRVVNEILKSNGRRRAVLHCLRCQASRRVVQIKRYQQGLLRSGAESRGNRLRSFDLRLTRLIPEVDALLRSGWLFGGLGI